MRLGQHQGQQAAQGMADDDGLQVVGLDIGIERFDLCRQDVAGRIGAGRFAGKARQIDDVQAILP